MPNPTRPTPARPLGLTILCAAAGACHDRGGGGGGSAPTNPLLVDFALRTDIHLGTAFLGDMLHLDLDGNGREDLVEANFGTRRLTLAAGEQDGTFTTLLELHTVGHAFRLASGDLDGNGMPDIAVVSGDWSDGGPQVVQVFLQGPAPFEFAAPVTFALSSDPKDLCTAPASGIVGSGGPDELFVALRDERRVLRLLLSGGVLVENGALDAAAIGRGSPFSVCALDLEGDGDVDIVVGEDNAGFDRVYEHRRDAAGELGPAALLLQPLARPVVDATGDMDANGFEDLAIAQFGADEVLLLAGDAGGLTSAHALDFGGVTTSLLFDDLDGDGLAEVMATVFHQESIQVRRGIAPFTWSDPVHYNVGVGPRAIGVMRVPGDDVPDLLCANVQDLSLLHGMGDARFRCATGAATGGRGPIVVELADLDGDGDLDAAVLTRFQESLLFLENQAGRLVTVNEIELAPGAEDGAGYLELADLDGDGDCDVLLAVYARDELHLLRNHGGPASFTAALPQDTYALGDGPFGLELGDLDGDGHEDVVVGLLQAEALQVLLGQSGGSFEALGPMALGFRPLDMHIADLDGDGHADVAASARFAADEGVALFSGDGTGALALERTYALAGRAGSIAAGDLDEDGRVDLVIAQLDPFEDDVAVLLNRGAFDLVGDVVAAPGAGIPIVADADEDGHLDLVVLTKPGELFLLAGGGTGAFAASSRRQGELPCPDDTFGARLGDIDGDGLPELVMVTPNAPFVWVAENISQELDD
jgi:hypothetical protein